MKYGKLEQEEFEKRCKKVFLTSETDHFYKICVDTNGNVDIEAAELDESIPCSFYFHYKPNMKTRPQALAYLLGKRDDFND